MTAIDLKRHIQLAVNCLEAMLPYCHDAGIATAPLEAYDEWDTLVEGVFHAFLVLPVCESGPGLAPHRFQRIGFEFSKKNLRYFVVYFEGQEFVLRDFVNYRSGKIGLEVTSLDNNDTVRLIDAPSKISGCELRQLDQSEQK